MASVIWQRQTFRTTGTSPERDGENFFVVTPFPGVAERSLQIRFRDGTHVMARADEVFMLTPPQQREPGQ